MINGIACPSWLVKYHPINNVTTPIKMFGGVFFVAVFFSMFKWKIDPFGKTLKICFWQKLNL